MFQIREYSLKDVSLIGDFSSDYNYLIWIPNETAVVIGRGNDPEKSLFLENVIKDGLPVYKRPTGGEAVIISRNTLVVSIVDNRKRQMKSQEYFMKYNSEIINALESLGVKGLSRAGISDIALNGKKIMGCSIYRNKKQVFYHAVLNINEEPEILLKYLRYPKKTPDYRSGRNHDEFVTSLRREGYDFSADELKRVINLGFASSFERI
jgi:lipoate-protein ligase A